MKRCSLVDEDDNFELVRGSGNIFADFGAPDVSIRRFRAVLAAEIVKVLDAEAHTGIAAADHSRIRQAKLDRFTIDRRQRILNRLNRDVSMEIFVTPRPRSTKRSLVSQLAVPGEHSPLHGIDDVSQS